MADTNEKTHGTDAAREADTASQTEKPRRKWLKRTLWGVPIVGSAALFVSGIIFWGGFNTAMEATNTLGFCISCHEMESTVYQEYRKTVHFQNRTGVRATCSDCHVPDPWIHKMIRKVEASRELYYKAMGSIDTPEKFEAKRLQLAKRVWKTMKETDSRECRNCHNFQSMSPEFQKPRARKQHLNAFTTGQTCIDCHKGIAHNSVRNHLTDAELEELETPRRAFAREIPLEFTASLKRVEKREAEEAAAKESAAKANEKQVAARIEKAVDKALADYVAKLEKESADKKVAAAETPAANPSETSTAAATPAPSTGAGWDGVEAKTVTLFYPGQASFEWVQNGRDHGGARAFRKAGDRCQECHAKEVADMGAKIVKGEKAEATPIPGKRGHIDVKVQASHDGENLNLRFQWPNAPHTPVPFVDGGKMDKENQVKLAIMFAGQGIDLIEQAGCWATCHHDSRYMPHEPSADDLSAAAAIVERLESAEGITKYLADTRTKIEIRGRGGKKRGGWNKLKDEAEIAELNKQGAIMDLIRYNSGGKVENGHVLDHRVMTGGTEVTATGKLEGDTWTVEMSRPLKSNKPGDISIEAGKLYTIGIAIHDDYTSARFHHVSLEYRFGLDNGEAEINAVKQ